MHCNSLMIPIGTKVLELFALVQVPDAISELPLFLKPFQVPDILISNELVALLSPESASTIYFLVLRTGFTKWKKNYFHRKWRNLSSPVSCIIFNQSHYDFQCSHRSLSLINIAESRRCWALNLDVINSCAKVFPYIGYYGKSRISNEGAETSSF